MTEPRGSRHRLSGMRDQPFVGSAAGLRAWFRRISCAGPGSPACSRRLRARRNRVRLRAPMPSCGTSRGWSRRTGGVGGRRAVGSVVRAVGGAGRARCARWWSIAAWPGGAIGRTAVGGGEQLRYACALDPDDVRALAFRHAGARGARCCRRCCGGRPAWRSRPWSRAFGSRSRTPGCRVPVLQYRVGPYFLDRAYPDRKIALEYDGRTHLTPERARRDLNRQAYVTREGWTVIRFPASVVLYETWKIPRDVRRLLEPRDRHIRCSNPPSVSLARPRRSPRRDGGTGGTRGCPGWPGAPHGAG